MYTSSARSGMGRLQRAERRRTRADFLKRFRSLALGESVNVVLLPAIFLILLDVPPTVPNLTGLGLVVLLLIQGSVYWVAKHRQLSRSSPSPPGIGTFARLRSINAACLTGGLVVILAGTSASPDPASWPGRGFWVFALLEYINYFYIQLMPTPAWGGWLPRTSRLARDLGSSRYTNT